MPALTGDCIYGRNIARRVLQRHCHNHLALSRDNAYPAFLGVRHANRGAQQVQYLFPRNHKAIKDGFDALRVPPDWLPVLDDINDAY